MRPYLLERHDERETHPATLTEFDLDLLEARARWGVQGAWIAVAAILLLIGLLVRSEWNARRIEASSRASTAALTENVRTLTEQLAARTAERQIASTALSATEERFDRLRGQVASIAARQRSLTGANEALAARIDRQGAQLADLGPWRHRMDEAGTARDARLTSLESNVQARAGDVEARLATLDRRVESMDKAIVAQGTQERGTRSRQNAMLGAVPLFLAPYIHILDHSGR